jgi:hypothetical protein
MLTPRRQLALDANLLLDLAAGRDFADEFREEFLRPPWRIGFSQKSTKATKNPLRCLR